MLVRHLLGKQEGRVRRDLGLGNQEEPCQPQGGTYSSQSRRTKPSLRELSPLRNSGFFFSLFLGLDHTSDAWLCAEKSILAVLLGHQWSNPVCPCRRQVLTNCALSLASLLVSCAKNIYERETTTSHNTLHSLTHVHSQVTHGHTVPLSPSIYLKPGLSVWKPAKLHLSPQDSYLHLLQPEGKLGFFIFSLHIAT